MFTSTFLFPDVNVWLALAHPIHPHHRAAVRWLRTIETGTPIAFCRITQLGLLRLLTTQAAMGKDVMTQSEAWAVLDVFFENASVSLLPEPAGFPERFRELTERQESSPKQWADGYLLAFAQTGALRLVTLDKALAKAAGDAILLP